MSKKFCQKANFDRDIGLEKYENVSPVLEKKK